MGSPANAHALLEDCIEGSVLVRSYNVTCCATPCFCVAVHHGRRVCDAVDVVADEARALLRLCLSFAQSVSVRTAIGPGRVPGLRPASDWHLLGQEPVEVVGLLAIGSLSGSHWRHFRQLPLARVGAVPGCLDGGAGGHEHGGDHVLALVLDLGELVSDQFLRRCRARHRLHRLPLVEATARRVHTLPGASLRRPFVRALVQLAEHGVVRPPAGAIQLVRPCLDVAALYWDRLPRLGRLGDWLQRLLWQDNPRPWQLDCLHASVHLHPASNCGVLGVEQRRGSWRVDRLGLAGRGIRQRRWLLVPVRRCPLRALLKCLLQSLRRARHHRDLQPLRRSSNSLGPPRVATRNVGQVP